MRFVRGGGSMKIGAAKFFLFLAVGISLSTAQAWSSRPRFPNDHVDAQESITPVSGDTAPPEDDQQIAQADNNQRDVNFVEGGGMVVTQVLQDESSQNSGLTHQRFVVRLSNGNEMEAVYNLDMCPRVPVNVGDVVAIGGQFIWTNQGGLIHWLHHDPKGLRPDGYVMVNGTYYCKH